MGPNQEFKDELDRLIDQQLLPEERDFVRTYDRAVLHGRPFGLVLATLGRCPSRTP